jgi:hypothetical protein
VAQVAAANRAAFFVTTSGSHVPECNLSTDAVPYCSEYWMPPNDSSGISGGGGGVRRRRLGVFAPSTVDVQQVKEDMVAMHTLTPSMSK